MPLGLGTVGVNRSNAHGLEGSSELGQFVFPVRTIDLEDTVLVGVQGHRAALALELHPQGL